MTLLRLTSDGGNLDVTLHGGNTVSMRVSVEEAREIAAALLAHADYVANPYQQRVVPYTLDKD